jgi:hypothetical protein
MTGQFSGFDLSKYNLPDIRTRRLDLYFNLDQNAGNDISQFTDLDTTKVKQGSLSGSVNLSYYHFRNTEKYKGELTVSTYFSPQFSKSRRNDLLRESKSINSSLAIQSSNSFYNKDKYFIKVDPYLSLSSGNNGYYRDLSSVSSRDEREAVYHSTLSVPVSLGHGRIEPVEDARLAIYILEELNRAGRISAIPEDNVVIEMAREISRIKKERFFDSRLRKIRELRVIDSFLVANSLISENDIDYFSVLNDQWDYAFGPSRESGLSVSAGFDNLLSFQKYYQKTIIDNMAPVTGKSSQNIFELGGFARIIYAKPVNLYWQVSGHLTASYDFAFTRDPVQTVNPVGNYLTGILRTAIGYSLQYLPNSRTSIELVIDGSYENSRAERTIMTTDPVGYQLGITKLSLYPGLIMYYYISPRFRIQLNSSCSLINHKTTSEYESVIDNVEEIWKLSQNRITLNLLYSFF